MGKKILIVDDEPDILRLMVLRLKNKGFEISTAVDGKEALDCAARIVPDLILLDMRLPFMNGIDVSKQLKKTEGLKHIPVIILTASADSIAERLAESAADDFLIKPFDPEVLLDKIQRYLG
jgi:CheY-like chemotaxis protein